MLSIIKYPPLKLGFVCEEAENTRPAFVYTFTNPEEKNQAFPTRE